MLRSQEESSRLFVNSIAYDVARRIDAFQGPVLLNLDTPMLNGSGTIGIWNTALLPRILITPHTPGKKTSFEEMAQSFSRRKPVLREQMKPYFDSGDSYSCRVTGPENIRFEIDGYPEESGYTGWYFEKTPIRVHLVESVNQTFSHWLINGKVIRTKRELEYLISSETTIEAVFKLSPSHIRCHCSANIAFLRLCGL